MAATKVMKFWAACLAVLGKLLASLGVSAAASAARREAVLHERTLGGAAPGTALPERGDDIEPEHDPHALTPATITAKPFVPAARTAPRYGQNGSVRRKVPLPTLPPTIKQRIHAEAHGASPTSRVRRTAGAHPLSSGPFGAPAHSGAAPVSPAIPAARRREHSTVRAV
ncbi:MULTISPECIES: DUF6344 domain-containing protein [unclassified Streptomyces]|uniref:DUF6344 domain-containing protein n=1 Tax=unclassified Streptomyces TaxID=2593676 RepID=UPI000C272A10|nr:DUF6344 domain-containing protein [Streptomyces sp. CB02959]PJN41432.1 hypothetical protein CG747_06470 [Streptomyces sp. CB02959]